MSHQPTSTGICGPMQVLYRLGLVALVVAAVSGIFSASIPVFGLQESASTPAETASPAADEEPAVVEVPRDGDLPGERAWEYNHYRVRVWFCSDGSSLAESYLETLPAGLVRLSRLTDACAWELLPARVPAEWRWACLNGIAEAATRLPAIGQSPLLQHDNKLTIVTLRHVSQGLECQVRELDLTTNQWGALLTQPILDRNAAAETLLGMLRTAFMPLARIDRVSEQNGVWMRVRGANLCQRVRFDPASQAWIVEPNTGSPARVRESDVFLPVLRRTDRDNKLLSQEPVEFTFVTIDPAGPPQEETATAPPADANAATTTENAAAPADAVPVAATETAAESKPAGPVDAAALFGKVHSTFRAPLVARKSKRLEKLALVVRPPTSSTELKLVSAENADQPMEGVEIWSRPLNAGKDDASEFVGKTDWRGLIEIPPSAEGLRVIYVKRGARSLMKLPIMPGFRTRQTSTMVNDEARLFAEGVIAGMGNEILDVVAQREIYQKMINDYLASEVAETRARAVEELEKYEALPKPQAIRARLTDEKARLLALSRDKREAAFVTTMFEDLEKVLSRFLGQSRETELRQKIQEQSLGVTPAQPSAGEAGAASATNGDAAAESPAPEATEPAVETTEEKPEAGSESPFGDS